MIGIRTMAAIRSAVTQFWGCDNHNAFQMIEDCLLRPNYRKHILLYYVQVMNVRELLDLSQEKYGYYYAQIEV